MNATKRPTLSLPLRYERISPEKRTGKGSSQYRDYAFEILPANIYQPNKDLIFCLARIPFGSISNISNEKEIAHLIVTAVNNFEELVNTLERCIMALATNGTPNCEAAKEARALLAKVKNDKPEVCGKTQCPACANLLPGRKQKDSQGVVHIGGSEGAYSGR